MANDKKDEKDDEISVQTVGGLYKVPVNPGTFTKVYEKVMRTPDERVQIDAERSREQRMRSYVKAAKVKK